MMPLEMGNVRSSKFGHIWRDEVNRELASLRTITGHDMHQCNECELSVFCNRCIGRNLSETGDLTTPAPSSCRNAAARARLLQSS
jgi:radical SAM protein with 4Fe4S-binding SPASM domain